jgi:hypothetical protein
MALQNVTVIDGRVGTRRLEKGEEYEIGGTLASDLMRAGYVEEIRDTKDEIRVPEYEAAALEVPEKAVKRAVKRRPRSGL